MHTYGEKTHEKRKKRGRRRVVRQKMKARLQHEAI